jgi:pimeloyl-ACP methyl ester carboxylesterase
MIPMRICAVEISGRSGLRPNWVSSSCQLSPRGRCISGGSMPPGGVESKVRKGAELKNAPISKPFWCTYPTRQRSLARLGLGLPGGLNDDFEAVRVPVLLLAGRHSRVFGRRAAHRVAGRFPNARTVVFEKSGHALQLEEPERFAEVVGDFAQDTV